MPVVAATHEVELDNGVVYLMAFVGAGAVREYGARRRRVLYVRTLRGSVEYRRSDAPEDD